MDKLKLIVDISDGLSTRKIADKYAVSQSTIKYWLKKFDLHTTPICNNKARGFKYDTLKIQNLIDDGLTYKELNLKIGISNGTLASLSKKGLIKFKSRSEIGKAKFASGDHPFHNTHTHVYKKPRGGYRKNAGRGRGEYVLDSFGKRTYLQSSFEIKCQHVLEKLGIKWIRPEYLPYVLDKPRKYYPDFYLVDYDVYLDPKNNFLIIKDFEKIKCVNDQNNVKVVVLSEDNITEEYILSVL